HRSAARLRRLADDSIESRAAKQTCKVPDRQMIDPSTLRPHYAAFLAPGRVLLTGHSHQAWPDVARAAQTEAFDDAARLADDKWPAAFAAADAVRAYVGRCLDCPPSQIALAANTHELVTRMLSACDLSARPRLVTTT